jgi:hypothetical protein
VIVAAHQDVGEQCKVEKSPGRGQAVEELLAVAVAKEEVANVAPASGEVVDALVEIARRPSHGPSLGS